MASQSQTHALHNYNAAALLLTRTLNVSDTDCKRAHDLANLFSIYHQQTTLIASAHEVYERLKPDATFEEFCVIYQQRKTLFGVSPLAVLNFLTLKEDCVQIKLIADSTRAEWTQKLKLITSIIRFNESERCKMNDLFHYLALGKYQSIEAEMKANRSVTKSTCHMLYFPDVHFLIYMSAWIDYGIIRGPYNMVFAALPMINHLKFIIMQGVTAGKLNPEQPKNRNMIQRIDKLHAIIRQYITSIDFNSEAFCRTFRRPEECEIVRVLNLTETKIHHLNKQTDKIFDVDTYNEFTSVLPIFRQIILIIDKINCLWNDITALPKAIMEISPEFIRSDTLETLSTDDLVKFIGDIYPNLARLSYSFNLGVTEPYVYEFLQKAGVAWLQTILIFESSILPGNRQILFICVNKQDPVEICMFDVKTLTVILSDVRIETCTKFILTHEPFNSAMFEIQTFCFKLNRQRAAEVLRHFHQLTV